jgi:hypothetical protein
MFGPLVLTTQFEQTEYEYCAALAVNSKRSGERADNAHEPHSLDSPDPD